MKIFSAIFLILATATAKAQDVSIGYISGEISQLSSGSQCEFRDRGGIVIKSDWINRFWMKIDGRMIEFIAPKADGDGDLKKWRADLSSQNVIVKFKLNRIRVGEDTATYKGSIIVIRDGIKKRIEITGGCGA